MSAAPGVDGAGFDASAFVDAFRDGTLAEFHHADHIRMAWLYVRECGLEEAIARFSRDLRHFAAAKGAPGLYHATITWAYLALIAERDAQAPGAAWDTFAQANPDLFAWKPSVLDTYYSEARLWSDEARARFVMPDIPIADLRLKIAD
ncbi:MAG: hypothetical protein AB7H88_02895 [Vicinamibacterales bacterium]